MCNVPFRGDGKKVCGRGLRVRSKHSDRDDFESKVMINE